MRIEHIRAAQAYLAVQTSGPLQTDERLRAEWAARVSALDLYVHELVSDYLVETVVGLRHPSNGFGRFHLSCALLLQAPLDKSSFQNAADLEIRLRLERRTLQLPDEIAESIRWISDIELWNEVVIRLGEPPITKIYAAKALKQRLTQIVNRRNKIVHEADLQPGIPRVTWPISQDDVLSVSKTIYDIVTAIDAIV